MLFVCCSVPRRTLHYAARALRRQQDTEMDQRDLSPEDKPGSLNHADKFPPTCMTTAPPGDTSQVPLVAESTVTPRAASKLDAPLTASKSRLSFYPQPPLPGRSRVGGRLGVSFCFSRREPRLEPSAPVFSDLEEEEREKREKMKERIKGIMEDICREIAEVEGRKCDDGGKFMSCSEGSGSCETVPISSGVSREEGDIEKGEMVKTSAPSDSGSPGLRRPFQTHNTPWGTALAAAEINVKHTDKEAEKRQESERAWKESQDTIVLGRDGSTYLRWPATLLKFTKTQPCISYSHNPLLLSPQQTEGLIDGVQEVVQKQVLPLSDSNPIILTPVIHTHLETHSREELQSSRKEKVEHFETIQHVDGDKEHLCLKENLSSPETGLDKRRKRAPIIQNSVRTASRPSDYSHCDSSTSNSQNPQGGRLMGVAEISGRAITTISSKAESVTQTGAEGTCTSPSRCECRCERASTPQPCVGVSGLSRKSSKAGVKKQSLKKKKKIKKEKTKEKSQSARCRVRSVVSTVSAGAWKVGESAKNWGKMKRRKVQSTVTSSLLRKWEGEPISVSVRKRRPHRSNSTESQSEAEREREQRERCRASSQLGRHAADRGTIMREGRPDRHSATVPWRSHVSLHSFSSGCNSELFWERGHHSNPRSFIDCCYPDNSCGCSPLRKRKLLHRDRLFIHCKRRSLRNREVWEERKRGRKTRGPSSSRGRGLNADAEQWDWKGGSCPRGLRATETEEWDQMTRFSPSPGRWSRGSRQISTDDADWDRYSVDRWTWSSSDSGEDRRTHGSISGSRTGADSRGSSDSVEKCARTVYFGSKHLLNSRWWTSRSSPQSMFKTQASRGCSPGSCSPCSSTGVSELSWDWSRSSTCSGAAVVGSTVSPCKATFGTRGLSSKGQKEQNSPVSGGTNNSSASPHRSCNKPPVPEVYTHYSDPNAPQVKEPKAQRELHQGAPVTTARSDETPGLSPDKSRSQKSAKVLLLPLIGKLPAIQKKAERRKAFLWKSQQKERENGAEGPGVGRDAREVANSQAESNCRPTPSLSLSEIRTADKQAVTQTAPPISFTPEEMDKYRLLQEQAREHMQKVLEQMQDDADTHTQTYTHRAQTTENCQTLEHYTPATLPNPLQPQIHPIHPDSVQKHPLQVTPTLLHVTSHENFPEALALGPPSLRPLTPSASLRRLPHVVLQHTAVSMPASSSSTSTLSPSTTIHPHPAQLPHPPHPLHPSLSLPLHLSPFSISSLFPSMLLSHSPFPLLPQSPAFHVTSVAPLAAVNLQPLTLQPFMDRTWPVRFQQKVL